MTEESIFRSIFEDLFRIGKETAPRGLKVWEIENYNYELGPYQRFCSFKARNLNVDYIKKEFMWYLKGDKFDLSILEHAKIWKDLVNEDGSINSNYGQYIFAGPMQFDIVVNTLKEDKDSRRAIMTILQPYHLEMKTKDVPCTISISFRIRENKLNMTVRMRSQDAVFGMGNDAPAFSFIHEMIYNALLRHYPDLEMGNYYHSVDSFHVYERHFEMVGNIDSTQLNSEFVPIECPRISGPDEVDWLRRYQEMPVEIPVQYQFSRWLFS